MPATTELAPPLNHVFVDFENVHQIDASVIGAKAVCLTLLLGAKQTKLDAGLVEKLMEHAASVQLIRLTSSGKNALDFALAYHVGLAVSANPASYMHIVSKDTVFDSLVEHLRSHPEVRAAPHSLPIASGWRFVRSSEIRYSDLSLPSRAKDPNYEPNPIPLMSVPFGFD